ncbi:MAG: hypothetical protein U0974_06590 [Gemmatimonadales bacterium]|nr:hypothetical protein [Gemmatimonadales bacterium]
MLIGEVDQGATDLLGTGGGCHGRGDILAPDHRGQAIRAEDQGVAALELLPGKIDADPGVRSERLQDDVAPGTRLGLFLGQLSYVHQSLGQRLVTGELPGDAIAHQVGAGVADLRQQEVVAPDPGDGGSGAHPPDLGVVSSVAVQLGIGRLDRLPEVVGKAHLGDDRVLAPVLADMFMDRHRGHLAGQFSGGGSPHPVGHHVEHPAGADLVVNQPGSADHTGRREIRHEEGVLVVVTLATAIGHGEGGGAGGRRRRVPGRGD